VVAPFTMLGTVRRLPLTARVLTPFPMTRPPQLLRHGRRGGGGGACAADADGKDDQGRQNGDTLPGRRRHGRLMLRTF